MFSDVDFLSALLSGRARSPLGGVWRRGEGEGERRTVSLDATLLVE